MVIPDYLKNYFILQRLRLKLARMGVSPKSVTIRNFDIGKGIAERTKKYENSDF
ncbi:hypothetical protein QUF82_05470 [Thiotrichales bacterium HSG14]|nr:hypothetical protein [Thiotrichales bacterium HSG14]